MNVPGGFATLVGVALAAALLSRLALVRPRGVVPALGAVAPWLALAPLAWAIAHPEQLSPARAALLAALAIALLARERDDLGQSECATKLTWALGMALALSWAGSLLLAISAGSAVAREQWPALALQLDPYAPWTSALALSLLGGIVLAGGAPFHFWLADLVQGAPAWLAPMLVAALQVTGAATLAARLGELAPFPQGDALARGLLALAAGAALVGGAATLATQRRPERRVGTLASLQGGLALAWLVAGAPGGAAAPPAAWGVHLALALAGAATFARLQPADAGAGEPAGPLARRHPWSALAGGACLLSLAGAPFTPGGMLYLAAARALAASAHPWLLAALAFAWLVGFAIAAREVRRAWGAPPPEAPPASAVPWPVRGALWCAALGLAALLATLARG